MLIDGKPTAIELNGERFHCALDVTMRYLGGKWKAVILWYLRKEPRRFSTLKRLIPDITEKMLSLQLRQLEKDGLVRRTVFAEVPPRVEYSLTDLGESLRPALEEIAAWGRRQGQERGRLVEVAPSKR
jgi:DNA-binding HxlR family transcriptional regulator